MDLPLFIESIKGKLKNFELSEEHTKSLGDELNIIFGSLIDERKRAKIPDELGKIIDCLELTPSDEEIFTKMHYITSATDNIAILTQSLTEAFPVTFHVLCLIFQNFSIAFRQSLGILHILRHLPTRNNTIREIQRPMLMQEVWRIC